jgi:hypothetical protein
MRMETILKAYSQREDHLPVIGRSIMMRAFDGPVILTRILHDLEAEQQWKYASRMVLVAPAQDAAPEKLVVHPALRRRDAMSVHAHAWIPAFFAWCFGILIAAIDDEMRLIHWRREYENSIDWLKFVSSQRRTDRKKHGALHISVTSCGH